MSSVSATSNYFAGSQAMAEGTHKYYSPLAKSIIAEAEAEFRGEDSHILKEIKELCSGGFGNNPYDHLIRNMMYRGHDRFMVGVDEARQFVIEKVPDFKRKVCSVDYFSGFGKRFYAARSQKPLLDVFRKSMENQEFKDTLNRAAKYKDSCYVDAEIRLALCVFSLAEQGIQFKDAGQHYVAGGRLLGMRP